MEVEYFETIEGLTIQVVLTVEKKKKIRFSSKSGVICGGYNRLDHFGSTYTYCMKIDIENHLDLYLSNKERA
jgi:hypothetical protein